MHHDFQVFWKGCELWAGSRLTEGRVELVGIVKEPELEFSTIQESTAVS